jgi:hypothetical protein
MMDDDEWAAEKEQFVEIERQRYAEGRAGGGGGGAAAAAQNADPFAPLQEALVKELEKYDRHRLDVISSYRLVPPVLMYGDPLEPSHPKRYEYWPSQRDNFPLLYEAARIILCVRYHSMGNERDHSVMGRIFSKVRGTLRGDSLECLCSVITFCTVNSSQAKLESMLNFRLV